MQKRNALCEFSVIYERPNEDNYEERQKGVKQPDISQSYFAECRSNTTPYPKHQIVMKKAMFTHYCIINSWHSVKWTSTNKREKIKLHLNHKQIVEGFHATYRVQLQEELVV